MADEHRLVSRGVWSGLAIGSRDMAKSLCHGLTKRQANSETHRTRRRRWRSGDTVLDPAYVTLFFDLVPSPSRGQILLLGPSIVGE
jgi:hypothetical protein